MNFSSIIVLLGVVLLVAFAIWRVARGGHGSCCDGGCSGGCAGCSGSCSCHSSANK